MASAAYWMASGARRIAAPATAQVGSIGVISMHREFSKALEGAGVRYTILAAGHYKAAGNAVEPLSDEMRAYLQEGIDAVYELFLSAVEQGRGVSREKTLAMADGKIFIAGEALKAGLIDRILFPRRIHQTDQTGVDHESRRTQGPASRAGAGIAGGTGSTGRPPLKMRVRRAPKKNRPASSGWPALFWVMPPRR